MAKEEEFGQKVTTEPEPEPTEPTLEERIETLQAKTDEATERADKAEKSAQGLRGSLQENEKKLREQTGSNTRMDGMEQRMEIIALAMDKGLSTSEVDGEKLNLKQEFADLKQRQADERTQDAAKLQQDESAREADGLWTRAKEFGTYQDNDSVAEIYDALVDGKNYKAERIIKRLEGTKPDAKKDSEDDLKKKWFEEWERQAREKDGSLQSDAGGPAGAATNDEKIRENYRANPNDPVNYEAYKELNTRQRKGKP